LLGRATSVAEFVKWGEESGHVKLTLRGEHKEDRITIMRKINISSKSEWFLNGKIFNTLDAEFY